MLGEFTRKNEPDTVFGSAGLVGVQILTTHEVWISLDEIVDFLL